MKKLTYNYKKINTRRPKNTVSRITQAKRDFIFIMVPKGNTKNKGGRDAKCCKLWWANSPPPGKTKVQNPDPRAYKNELNPNPRAFSSIIHYKNMENETEIM